MSTTRGTRYHQSIYLLDDPGWVEYAAYVDRHFIPDIQRSGADAKAVNLFQQAIGLGYEAGHSRRFVPATTQPRRGLFGRGKK